MVELVFSEKLRQAFRKGGDDARLDANLRKELRALVAEPHDTVPYPTVLSFWKAASAAGVTTERLHELVAGSMIHEKAYEPPAKSAELVARLQKLEALQLEREYRRMVADVDQEMAHERKVTDLRELKNVKQQAFMMMNLVLSFAGVWAFVYYALHATLSSQGMRALAATLAALVALAAEMWLYLKADVMHDPKKSKKKGSGALPRDHMETITDSATGDVPLIAKSIQEKKDD